MRCYELRHSAFCWAAPKSQDMNTKQNIQILYYRLERLFTRPVRKLLFRRVWQKKLPIAMITGSHGKTTTSRMLANILKHAGHTVGLACSDGVFVDGELVKRMDGSSYYGARKVLRHPAVTAAVLETGAGGVSLQGLYVDTSNVSVLLNLLREHIGEYGVKSADHLLSLKQQVLDCAEDAAIVNMEDDNCVRMMDTVKAARLIVYSLDPDNAALKRALALGHTAFTLDADKQNVVLKQQDAEKKIVARVEDILATSSGLAFHNIANAMAAAGLALGLGIDLAFISTGLQSADASIDRFATRFNVIDDYPFTLVIDKALGPGSLDKSLQAQAKLKITGKRYCLLTSLGNKSDEVLLKIAEQLTRRFDAYLVYDVPGFRRGKPAGDIVVRYSNALRHCGVPEHLIVPAADLPEAIDKLSPLLAKGDLVFAQYMLDQHLVELAPKLQSISMDIASATNKKTAP